MSEYYEIQVVDSSMKPKIPDDWPTPVLIYRHNQDPRLDIRKKRHDLNTALQTFETLHQMIKDGHDFQGSDREKILEYLQKALEMVRSQCQLLRDLFRDR